MSEPIAELSVKVGADLSGFEQGMARLTAGFQQLSAKTQAAEKEIENTFARSDRSLNRSNATMRKSELAIAKVELELAKMAVEADRAGDKTRKAFEGADSGAKTFGSTLSRITAANQIGQLGAGMERAGKQVLGMVGTAVKAAGDFESNLNVFQATSQATAKEMEVVSKKAIDLGNDLSLPATSAKTAIDAMLSMKRAGLSLNDTLAGSKGALMLAAAGAMDAGKAAAYTANTLKVFHLEGKEANKVVDMMAALLPAAGSKIEETAKAVQYGGTAFAQAKIPLSVFMTEIGEMAQAGLKGSRAGSALAQMLTNLQAPSKQGAAVLRQLGVTIYDSNGVMKDQRTIIEELGTKINGLSAKDRDYALKTLFSTNARRAANVVLLGGVDAFDKMAKSVDVVGAAQSQSEARMKGYKGAMEALNNQIETLQITMGQKLIPQVTKLLGWVSKLVEKFNSLSDGTQSNIIRLATIGGIMLVVGGKVLSLAANVIQLKAAWDAMRISALAAGSAQAVGAGGAAATGGSLIGRGLAWLGGGTLGAKIGATGIGIGTGLMALTAAQQAGGTYDSPAEVRSLKEQILATQNRLVSATAELKKWSLMTPEAREEAAANRHGRNIFGGLMRGRDEIWGDLQGAVSGLTAKLKTLKDQLAATANEGDLASKIIQHAGDAIKTPAGQASCAYFASEVMRAAGAAIPKIGSAGELRKYLLSHGGIEKPGAAAQPGDYLMFHGPGYGTTKDAEGNGNHAAIYLGNGLMRQSSGGVIKTKRFTDTEHATAITLPDVMSSVGAKFDLEDSIAAQKAAEAERKRLLKQAERDAKAFEEERRNQAKQTADDIFALTHTELETKKRQFAEEERDAVAAGVSKTQAHKRYLLQVRQAEAEEREQRKQLLRDDPFTQALEDAKAKIGELSAATTVEKVAFEIAHKPLSQISEAHRIAAIEIAKQRDEAARLTAEQDKQKQAAERLGAGWLRWAESVKAAREEAAQTVTEAHLELQEAQARAQGLKEGSDIPLLHFRKPGLTEEQLKQVSADKAAAKQINEITDASERAKQKLAELRAEMLKLTTGNGEDRLSLQFKGAPAELLQQIDAQADANKAYAKQQEEQRAVTERSQNITHRLGEAIADVNDQIARAIGHGNAYDAVLSKLNLATRDLSDSQKEMVKELADKEKRLAVIQEFADGTRSIVQGLFQNLVEGGKGFFSAMEQGFTRMFQQIAVEYLTNQAMRGLSSLFGGLAGGGKSGVGGGIVGVLSEGDLFGGAFASGGRPPVGVPSLVGERGPELFIPDRSGTIVPNHALAGAGGGDVHITINVTTPDAESFRRTQGQVMHDVWRAASRAMHRNG